MTTRVISLRDSNPWRARPSGLQDRFWAVPFLAPPVESGRQSGLPRTIGWTPWGAFLQEHTEDHPMARLQGPAIEVWLEPQLPETVPLGSTSDLK